MEMHITPFASWSKEMIDYGYEQRIFTLIPTIQILSNYDSVTLTLYNENRIVKRYYFGCCIYLRIFAWEVGITATLSIDKNLGQNTAEKEIHIDTEDLPF